MEHQRRTQASFTRWEQERWRQERESMERWRQEARDHERALFGMFCTAMSKCNAAITAVLKAKNTSASNSAAAAAGRFNITRCSSIIGYLRCAVHRPIRVTSSHAVAGSFSVTFRGTPIREPHTKSTLGLTTKNKTLMTSTKSLR